MITRQTVIDKIEVTRDGAVALRLGLLLVEDGHELDCKWHRTVIAPAANIDEQVRAVNAHITADAIAPGITGGYPPIEDVAVMRLRAIVATARK